MRMIPGRLNASTLSAAEKRLFSMLQAIDLGPEAVCFHSLNLTRHHRKRFAEADFVIINTRGIFVLEIKGGSIRRNDHGIWEYTNITGRIARSEEGPFNQAHGALMALRKRITAEFGGEFLSSIPLGYGVVFPNCKFDVKSVEWEDWMVADSRAIDTFGNWLKILILNWEDRLSGRARRFNDENVSNLTTFLRPSFEVTPTLSSRITQAEDEAATFTESQLRLIRCLDDSHQILCGGGAGTGKTYLAAELARRWSREPGTTLLVCQSPWLLSHLRQEIKVPGTDIRTIASIIRHPPAKPYERLIVDEGQDLLNHKDLDLLNRTLANGLGEGRWAFFYDINNQAGVIGAFETDALTRLQATRPAILTLSENCRNTREILAYIHDKTRCDMGTRGYGPGPDVKTEILDPTIGCAAAIDRVVDELLEDHVAAGEITILTALPAHQSALRDPSALKSSIEWLDEITIAHRPYRCITIAPVSDFKGLENNIIILVEIEKITNPATRRTLAYIGMSRARALLINILPPDIQLHIPPTPPP